MAYYLKFYSRESIGFEPEKRTKLNHDQAIALARKIKEIHPEIKGVVYSFSKSKGGVTGTFHHEGRINLPLPVSVYTVLHELGHAIDYYGGERGVRIINLGMYYRVQATRHDSQLMNIIRDLLLTCRKNNYWNLFKIKYQQNDWCKKYKNPKNIKQLVIRVIQDRIEESSYLRVALKEENPKLIKLNVVAIANIVKQYFPKSKFKESHAHWYQQQLNKGLLIPSIARKEKIEKNLSEEIEKAVDAKPWETTTKGE